MNRMTVLQQLIDRLGAGFYLEIGVERGIVLLGLRVRQRIGVDPCFRIPWQRKLVYAYRLRRTQCFEMTSDEFFARHSAALPASGIPIAFIDGLHTYQQSLADLEHCLEKLHPGGVIVLHDCNPHTPQEAAPLQADSDGLWFGGVWKTIVHVRSLRPELSACVLDTDCGMGIVFKQPATYPMLGLPQPAIEELAYADLERHRADYLGLTPAADLDEILARLSPLAASAA